MPAPLRFYFDVISPYAYLAWTQVHGLADGIGRTVEPIPVLFAAMLNAHGHKGPAEIPPKRTYIFKHVVRLAHGLGVELQPPPAHPFNPLLALRLASVDQPAPQHRTLIDLLMRRAWGNGGGVTDPDALVAAMDHEGLDGRVLLEQASATETKQRLRTQTDAAIGAGVFGVPTYVLDGESFWGLDATGHIEAFARGEDPVSSELIETWASLPAGAQRKP